MSTAQTQDNLLFFPSGEISPVALLEKAKSWQLENVAVIGWDSSGAFVWGSSMDDAKEMSFLLMLAHNELMRRVSG